MKKSKNFAFNNLSTVLKDALELKISKRDRFIVFSDLHMGNGSSMDDFKHNGKLFEDVLNHHYLRKGYTLILNGDIEELQKFSFKSIRSFWKNLYTLFEKFQKKKRLYKLIGNHDEQLQYITPLKLKCYEALKLAYKKNTLFVFHGHQASILFEKYNNLVRFVLRNIASPLHIKNLSVAGDSKKKFGTEERVYHFALKKRIIAVIGHTHRPLFESRSKIDAYRMKIEELCRTYPKKNSKQQENIKSLMKNLKNELVRLMSKKSNYLPSIYNSYLAVPSLFNSGCAIGKRGITGIEIKGGEIALVHWFDKTVNDKYLNNPFTPVEPLKNSLYCKAVLEKEQLSYIISRVKLLT